MGDSPVKKLNLEPAGKENTVESTVTDSEIKKPVVKPEETTTVKAPKTPKELEAEEAILQENPRRYVLFPIQYHEVSFLSDASRVKWLPSQSTRNTNASINRLDLANVQEGRGLILDRGRDRSLEGSPRLEQQNQR